MIAAPTAALDPRRHPYPIAVGLTGTAITALVVAAPPAGVALAGRAGLGFWLALGTAIAVVDARDHRIPNNLVGLLAAATMAGVGVAAVSSDQPTRLAWLALWATVATLGAIAVHVVSAGGLGMGDVKLVFPVALVLGWFGPEATWLAVMVAPVLASLVVVGRGLARRPQQPVPLAPHLLAGVAVALLVA